MAQDYVIVGQRQVDELTRGGSFVPMMEVTVEVMPEGVPIVIKVPINQYEADFVRAEIEQRVKTVKAVQAL